MPTPIEIGSLVLEEFVPLTDTITDIVGIRYVATDGDDTSDGKTMQTSMATIQAAIDALPANGGCVMVGPGDYTEAITSSHPNLAIVGIPGGGLGQHAAVGTGAVRINVPAGSVGFTFNPSAASTLFRGPALRDLTIVGTSASSGGIKICRSNNWQIENVSCTGFTTGYGILSDGTGNVNQYGTIFNPNLTNCLVGLDIKVSNGLRVFGGMIDANSNSGAVAASSTGIRIQSGDTQKIFGTVIQYASIGIDDQSTSLGLHTFSGLRVEGCTTGFKIASDGNQILGGNFSNSVIGGIGTAIDIQASSDSTLICYPQFSSVATTIADAGTNTVIQTTSKFQTTSAGQIVWGKTGPTWKTGSGSPLNVVSAAIGSLYTRIDGGTNTTLYVKESGTDATGWVPK